MRIEPPASNTLLIESLAGHVMTFLFWRVDVFVDDFSSPVWGYV